MADTYEIISQTPRTRSAVGGVFQNVTVITAKTKPSEQIFTVDIPDTVYSIDEVDKALCAKAALIEAVQKL